MASAPPSTERLAMTLFMRAKLGLGGWSVLEECDRDGGELPGHPQPAGGIPALPAHAASAGSGPGLVPGAPLDRRVGPARERALPGGGAPRAHLPLRRRGGRHVALRR